MIVLQCNCTTTCFISKRLLTDWWINRCMCVCDILVFQLPKIDWSAYSVTIPSEPLKPPTRKTSNKPADSSSDSVILVRGRMFDDSKPETFNQVCVTQRLFEKFMLLTCTEIAWSVTSCGQDEWGSVPIRSKQVSSYCCV
jgi:hypothetical protein